jgi:hypothetical protein
MSVSDPGKKLSGERIANLEKMSECPALAIGILKFYRKRPSLPVFAKTSPKPSLSIIINELFGLVFKKTGPTNLGTGKYTKLLVYSVEAS